MVLIICPCLNSRWVISRIKRILLGCTFLCIAFTAAISIFILLNRSTNHQKLANLISYFASPLKSDNPGSFATQRPMVQFYPDNQQKHLFEKNIEKPQPPNSYKLIQTKEYNHHSKLGNHEDKDNYENVLTPSDEFVSFYCS